jgi:hypothetical protein
MTLSASRPHSFDISYVSVTISGSISAGDTAEVLSTVESVAGEVVTSTAVVVLASVTSVVACKVLLVLDAISVALLEVGSSLADIVELGGIVPSLVVVLTLVVAITLVVATLVVVSGTVVEVVVDVVDSGTSSVGSMVGNAVG